MEEAPRRTSLVLLRTVYSVSNVGRLSDGIRPLKVCGPGPVCKAIINLQLDVNKKAAFAQLHVIFPSFQTSQIHLTSVIPPKWISMTDFEPRMCTKTGLPPPPPPVRVSGPKKGPAEMGPRQKRQKSSKVVKKSVKKQKKKYIYIYIFFF